MRILGKAASKEQSVEVPAHIQKILEGAHRANDFVVLPLDSFWLDNEDEFFCIVNELYGHNLSTILDQGLNGPESARWTRKLFQETLMALSLLHSCDISHGGILPLFDFEKAVNNLSVDVMEWSILLTYPVLKFANFEGVQKSYQSQDLGTSETEGPDTSDTEEPSVNFDFRVKLQNLRKGKYGRRLTGPMVSSRVTDAKQPFILVIDRRTCLGSCYLRVLRQNFSSRT